MQAVFFLIPLALLFCALMIKAFFWAVSQRQFENLDAAAHSILFDDDERAAINTSADTNTPSDTHTQTGMNTATQQEVEVRHDNDGAEL